ncbi:hypothetical protein FE783_10710 [Paenibacillus mesophilus]|uniref:hypothetical protein n=1 Tax=Paenibacillus mesophilus TaxID=2582849 RepID=UPI00110E10AB|nr:hypothetical protein [Paenibacillus mesophilus]TMV50029.1 hypothetical protein FE783_10710 [Paenibacillus mesophilus]
MFLKMVPISLVLLAAITGCDSVTSADRSSGQDPGAGGSTRMSGSDESDHVANDNSTPLTADDIRKPDPSFASNGSVQYAIKQGNKLTIAHKYSASDDMWIVFDYHGANRLYGFSQWRLAANTGEQVDPDMGRASSLLQNAVTDWIGPYIVKADKDADVPSQHFTGGAHAFNGADKGSATARTVSYSIRADGVELADGQVTASERITIQVVNHVQGYNTKVEDGSGREILKETVTYEVVGGRVQVHTEIEALEDITIYRYYGLQTVNQAWSDKVAYYAKDKIVSVNPGKLYSDSGKLSANPNVDQYVLTSDDSKPIRHHLLVWLDRKYGIGTMEHVAAHRPASFTYEYGKTYFLQIVDTAPVLAKGKTFSWRGGYHFFSRKGSS